MFQNFLLRKMLRTQGVPEAQIEMFLNIIEKNPELFKKIAEEVKVKTDSGMDQQTASIQVMQKYQDELPKLA
jgi:2-oxo-4-hydroxy-4-carboxy--5-ureidoimidazoline (OHCU) decarboxylase